MRDVPGTQAVSRAFLLLRAVTRARANGVGLAQLAREVGLSKPTVHRLLLALLAEGMIEQDPVSAHYFIGRECFVLGSVANERFGFRRIAPDVVARLAQYSDDSAFFSIRSDVHAVCVIREDGDFPLKTHVLQPGMRHPLGVGAGSLAMLAAIDDAGVERCLEENAHLLAANYPNYTPDILRQQVAETRARGYAVNRGLVVAGSWGVGAAVLGEAGDVIGALSIAAVDSRLPESRQQELGAKLLEEAAKLEQLIDGHPNPPKPNRRSPQRSGRRTKDDQAAT